METEYSYFTYEGVEYPFCVIIVTKYKLFTWEEFKLVRECFGTDLSELDAVLTWYPNPVIRLKVLYFMKYEFEIRFYSKEDNEKYREVFKKLIFKLDDLIFNDRINHKVVFEDQNPLQFSDLFIDKVKADQVKEGLIENNYVVLSDGKMEWRTLDRHAGIEVVALFKYLSDKNLLKVEYKNDSKTFMLISKLLLNVDRNLRTFQRLNDFATIEKSKMYSFLSLKLGII
jgi:hypothetical protein